MKTWKMVSTYVGALMLITISTMATPDTAAQRYAADFKMVASQRNTKAQDFEAFCRLMRSNFDTQFLANSILTPPFLRNKPYSPGFPETDKAKLVLGYLAAYGLEKMEFFREARADLNQLGYYPVSSQQDLIDGVRVTAVTFKVRPTGDNVTIYINRADKVLDIYNVKRLTSAAAIDLSGTDSYIDKYIGYYISGLLGDSRYSSGCP